MGHNITIHNPPKNEGNAGNPMEDGFVGKRISSLIPATHKRISLTFGTSSLGGLRPVMILTPGEAFHYCPNRWAVSSGFWVADQFSVRITCKRYTPPKFNMEPENHPLEKEKTSSKSSFLGSMLVFRGIVVKY